MKIRSVRANNRKKLFEVKTRTSSNFGEPYEAVGPAKQQKIICAATAYLKSLDPVPPCRFDVISIRQHHLHYDIRVTPAVQAQAGFLYDSSLGFNDNIGFRFGTCYPWHLYDLVAERELPLKEIPLIVQDGAMLDQRKGMRLDENTAFQYVRQITATLEKVGGVLTLLWHPDKIVFPDWWQLYQRTLKYLQQKDPWFASVREVGEWSTRARSSTGKVGGDEKVE